MAIPTQDPWNSSHVEHPRESCEPVKAGQRRKCHIIDLADCSSIPEAGQRRKCHIIDLAERSRIDCDSRDRNKSGGQAPHSKWGESSWQTIRVFSQRGTAENVTE